MFSKNLFLVLTLVLFTGSLLTAQDYDYIGAAKCKMCHNKAATGAQYKVWSESKHAHAMDALVGDEKTDPKCIKCHATAGGVDPDLITTLKMSESVSCESCHGAGSGYKSKTVMQDREKAVAKGLVIPTEEVCIRCHNEESPNFKGFNYDEYMKKIAHPIPAAE